MGGPNATPAPKPTEVNVNDILADAQKTGNLSEAKFMALLSIMMAKEARLAEKEAALEVAYQAKEKQRKKESETYTVTKIENQRACKHLKGGKGRTRAQQRDPAVYLHTYPDGSRVIKCNLCSARWMPKDTRDYLSRNGNAIPNWTRIGWAEAFEMCEDSSNKASSSERFGQSQPTGSMPTGLDGLQFENLQL